MADYFEDRGEEPRPLGVLDLELMAEGSTPWDGLPEHWFWCRYHKRPECSAWNTCVCGALIREVNPLEGTDLKWTHIDNSPGCDDGYLNAAEWHDQGFATPSVPAFCRRYKIGPFMSENEALRLGKMAYWQASGRYVDLAPLGMEVES